MTFRCAAATVAANDISGATRWVCARTAFFRTRLLLVAGSGGISNGGTLTVVRSTISVNTVDEGGGGVSNRGTRTTKASVRVSSSIIAGNETSDVSVGTNAGPFASGGYNLVGTGDTTSFDKMGDRTGVTDPGLGPLASNGGPTRTHAPRTGSPAPDKGDGGGLAQDQRSQPRPADLPDMANARGGSSDVGFFELQNGGGGGGGPQGCTIRGTAGDNELRGTVGGDVICGFGGNDTIRGFGGDDELRGGPGNDEILGGRDGGVISGGGGNDTLPGNRSADRIFAGLEIDRLRGDLGNALLSARDNRPSDRLFGGEDRDTCHADRGDIVSSCER